MGKSFLALNDRHIEDKQILLATDEIEAVEHNASGGSIIVPAIVNRRMHVQEPLLVIKNLLAEAGVQTVTVAGRCIGDQTTIVPVPHIRAIETDSTGCVLCTTHDYRIHLDDEGQGHLLNALQKQGVQIFGGKLEQPPTAFIPAARP